MGTKGTWYDHTVSVRNAEPKTEDAAAETAAVPADGSYTCAVTLEGGSGRATVESPAALTVADGTMTAVIVWSLSLIHISYRNQNTAKRQFC